ncbi:hypothetical protein CSUI_004431 [Cystoisospora suis]|uniref:Secreted protein n=1 Tax=Cystoisospora suis TaxID=483139 RepID=A0A2C6KMM8_9APIC|nr:hypothetical protein CSUI_004431 [Cystoisospora suis]
MLSSFLLFCWLRVRHNTSFFLLSPRVLHQLLEEEKFVLATSPHLLRFFLSRLVLCHPGSSSSLDFFSLPKQKYDTLRTVSSPAP